MSGRNVLSKYASYVTSQKNIERIILLGDSAVGKTSIVRRFVENSFSSSYNLTVGGNFSSKKFTSNDGTSEVYIISDVGGQQRFEDVRSAFYNDSDIILAVCDLTRKNTLKNLDSIWIPEFLREVPPKKGFKTNIQLIGNKCDLMDLMVISMSDLEKTALSIERKYPQISIILPCLMTSAKENMFINEAFGLKKEND